MTENSGETAMAEEGTRSRLGRGLAALIGDVGDETSARPPARAAAAADRFAAAECTQSAARISQ